MSKHFWITLAIIGTLVALATIAGALSLQTLAQAADNQAPAQPAGGDRAAALRERMQDTAKELNLTDEQKEKLIAASPELQRLWNDFQAHGMTQVVTAKPVLGTLVDGHETLHTIQGFFLALEQLGFTVTNA